MADDDPTQRMPRLVAPAGPLASGSELGDYVVISELGSGGMGAVYHVRHRPSGRNAALKIVRPPAVRADAVARFEREVRALGQLQHPHIVEIYEFGALSDGTPFLVMEHLPGMTVLAHVRRFGKMPLSSAVPVVAQVAEALVAAHDAGILHRDVKPSNVVLSHRHRRQRAVLVDFGIVKFMDDIARITQRSQVVGTLPWMAPEQFLGAELDARTDVYGLGALAYSMLTGRQPFADGDHKGLLRGPRPQPSTEADLPPAVDAVIMRAMDVVPAARFANPGDLAEALRAAAAP
jgi:serine/threonine-protein kinase